MTNKVKGIIFVFVCIFFTLSFLVLQTVYETHNDMWSEQGRAYDVKVEYYTHAILTDKVSRLYKKGATEDDWYIRALNQLRRYLYNRAIKKIPEDDVERDVYFYSQYIAAEISRGDRFAEELDSPEVREFILKVMKNAKAYQARSSYARDVEFPGLISNLAVLFVANGDRYYGEEKYLHLADVVNAMHYAAMNLSAERMLAYPAPNNSKEILYSTLRIHNWLLSKSLSDKDATCDLQIAEKVLELNEKIETSLVDNAQEISRFITDMGTMKQFNNFVLNYKKSNLERLSKVQYDCNMVSNGEKQ